MAAGFLIAADDLTGAMDSAVQFARRGFSTALWLRGAPAGGETEVLAVTTDSRELPAAEAAARAAAAGRAAFGRRLYKKFDSTLRGNLGAELEALLAACGARHALLTPAYPDNGRVVHDGFLYVGGRRLRETDFGRDPTCPPTDHVPGLLAAQCRRPVTHLALEVVRRGAQAVETACAGAPQGVVVCDAESADDLHAIAGAALALGGGALAAGSAGLARALAEAARPAGQPPRARPRCRRVLVVSGSRRRAAVDQAARVAAAGELAALEAALREGPAGLELAVGLPADGVPSRAGALLSVSDTRYLAAREEEVARAVGQGAAATLERLGADGLVLVGGATARAACAALSIERLDVLQEILPGAALGRVQGGPQHGLWVATKAGGFGDERALLRILEHLKGEADG